MRGKFYHACELFHLVECGHDPGVVQKLLREDPSLSSVIYRCFRAGGDVYTTVDSDTPEGKYCDSSPIDVIKHLESERFQAISEVLIANGISSAGSGVWEDGTYYYSD